MNHIPRNLTQCSPGYACGDNAYMEQIYSALEALGCTRSDAQGIADANERKIAYGYLMGTTPHLVAVSLFDPMAPSTPAPPTDPVSILPPDLSAL